MSTTFNRSTLLAAGAVAATGIVAYAVYFDYKRRTNSAFRKQLRKEKKRVAKTQPAPSAGGEEAGGASVDINELRGALEKVRQEEVPVDPQQKEQYFMSQVSMGEQLCAQGPMFHLPAAMCFYRALRVYPAPVELIMIYEKTVPQPVFQIVMELTNLDVSDSGNTSSVSAEESVAPTAEISVVSLEEAVAEAAAEAEAEAEGDLEGEQDDGERSPTHGGPPSESEHSVNSQEWDRLTDPGTGVQSRVEGYYDHFPRKEMNVKVETRDLPDGIGKTVKKKVLVAAKDFAAGEVIYKEVPVVAALDFDIEGKGTHCSQCFRVIEGEGTKSAVSARFGTAYCSPNCAERAKAQSDGLLFTLDPVLPAAMLPELPPDATEQRDAAQTAFIAQLREASTSGPLLAARFIARQVNAETAKMLPGGMLDAQEPSLADGGDYGLYDHLERLRYLAVEEVPEEKLKGVRDVLKNALPGLETFVTDERYATMLGKMAYNSFGVVFGEGRDGKPVGERPEDLERTRTPAGTSRQVGTAFFAVSAYLSHSCAPNAHPSFNGTTELSLVAERDVKKGDELNVSYVDLSSHEGETPAEARRRRRFELARGWKFACPCTRCVQEALEAQLAAAIAVGAANEAAGEPAAGTEVKVEEEDLGLGGVADASQVEDAMRRTEEREKEKTASTSA
ncbi:MAS20-domain-containing protein [Coniophora puteana RWD-64-598 SS2]|uniref:Mitochondrial import receptor subunit TOM20 n=1 Tax=Coniophora puteana (strain RWD-64-598) TaxID=741705 RepID=A0A5M3MB26_CONPW|nr:MAS20-domain-containing protein [Coniophora puteana RWD-64-598 SS2]EIW76196.1 MAS20-domain-containing protein [Coniophora puteana RWD-64-598 SS2]